jgi:hypothetical protein
LILYNWNHFSASKFFTVVKIVTEPAIDQLIKVFHSMSWKSHGMEYFDGFAALGTCTDVEKIGLRVVTLMSAWRIFVLYTDSQNGD